MKDDIVRFEDIYGRVERLMLEDITFKTVVDSTTTDFYRYLIQEGMDKVLLGKRVNKPAQGYFFSTGGRINKNETIDNAMTSIALKMSLI